MFNWKNETQNYVKPPGQWHFQFNPCKRFIIRKNTANRSIIEVQGEVHYNADVGVPKTIIKKNKKFSMCNPVAVPILNSLKGDKTSIDTLLKKHYGDNWRNNPDLQFYKVIDSNNRNNQHEDNRDLDDERLDNACANDPAESEVRV